MPLLEEKLSEWMPSLMISREDPETPVDVSALLRFQGLYYLVRGRRRTRVSRSRLHAENPEAMLMLGRARKNSYLTAGILNKQAESDQDCFHRAKVDKVIQVLGDNFPALVEVQDDASALLPNTAKVPNKIRSQLKTYSVISYYFHFLTQDGRAFGACPLSWEGQWVACSVLVENRTLQPRLIGFHGLHGVEVKDWNSIHQNDRGQPRAFVCIGTHSLVSAPGDQEGNFRTAGQALLQPRIPVKCKIWRGEENCDDPNEEIPITLLLLAAVVAASIPGGLPIAALLVLVDIILRILEALGVDDWEELFDIIKNFFEKLFDWFVSLFRDNNGSSASDAGASEDAEGQANAVETSMSNARFDPNDWQRVDTTGIPAETWDPGVLLQVTQRAPALETASEYYPERLALVGNQPWWITGAAFGDLDIDGFDRLRLAPGRRRPALSRDFVLACAKVLG